MNLFLIQSHLQTHLVFEFEVTPIPFLMELFIDSTGEVVMASKDMEIFLTYMDCWLLLFVGHGTLKYFNCFYTDIA
jgi:hypothetical protein